MAKQAKKIGVQTKPQGLDGVGAEASYMLRLLQQDRAPSGTYRTYREMLEDPTIALSHAATTAPIISAACSVEADDDAKEDAVRTIEDTFLPQIRRLISNSCRSIYYGWQSFEKVWKIDDDGRLVIERFKPLVPDNTTCMIDRQTGALNGVKQNGVELDRGHCLVITHDSEGDNPYGRSRMENLRKWAWKPWTTGMAKLAQYQSKAAGIIPVVRYPEGQGQNAAGQVVRNYEAASQMILQLSQAFGIAMPNTIPDWAMEAARQGINVSDVMAWSASFLETSPGHASEFVEALSYQDKLKVRGYLLPERAILEGQHGTKAEAGTHGDIAVQISQQFLDYVVDEVNKQCVDDVLSANFGPSEKGKVYIKPGPIQDEARALVSGIVTSLYSSNPDLAMAQLDFNAMLDSLRLPKVEEDISDDDGLDVVDTVDATAPVSTDAAVQDTSLTGVQITSLRELADAVTRKQTSVETAKNIAYVSFPTVDRRVLDSIMDGAASFTPAPEVEDPVAKFSRTIGNSARGKRAK